MTNKALNLFISTILIFSCSDNKAIKKTRTYNFTTYELSFFDGWSKRFSFSLDTSKVYLAVSEADTLRYGILPDSVFEIINKNAFLLFNDNPTTKKNKECNDCSEISILATLKNDTVRLVQKGDASDRVFLPVVEAVNKYLETSRSSWKLNPFQHLLFRTLDSISPPLPPETKPPKKNKIIIVQIKKGSVQHGIHTIRAGR